MYAFPSSGDLETGKLGEHSPLMEQCTRELLFKSLGSKLRREHDKSDERGPARLSYVIQLRKGYFGPVLVEEVIARIREESEWTETSYDAEKEAVTIARPAVASVRWRTCVA